MLGPEVSMAATEKSSTITVRSFVSSVVILGTLMLAAGLLTLVVPAGSFDRITDAAGRQVVVPGTYHMVESTGYSPWRWLTAPLEVLASEDAATALVIIAFIIIVGGSFAILREAGALRESIRILSERFRNRRLTLLAVLCLFFMLIGSFMGIFEEVIPLVPLAIALSLSLGWDVFAGLGMSILAVGFGFSAAVANPFSIGTAQRLAGLPVLSGSGFRLLVFGVVYAFYLGFMIRYVKKLERTTLKEIKGTSLGGSAPRKQPQLLATDPIPVSDPSTGRGASRSATFFAWGSAVLALLIGLSSATGIGSDFILPGIALGFLLIGTGSGLAAGVKLSRGLRVFLEGAAGVAPAALLILMALGVKRIVVAGGIMDTVLYGAARLVADASAYGAAGLMYAITLVMNFFIGSASAKAFLLIPLLAPLADLSGVSRQIAVQAFAFGDGFSNMLYPTNAVLLIALGLAGMPWTTWLAKTWKLQLGTLVLTMALLMLAVAIGYH
jgi:uncharacterized ion transporter superfamily protein YfcC